MPFQYSDMQIQSQYTHNASRSPLYHVQCTTISDCALSVLLGVHSVHLFLCDDALLRHTVQQCHRRSIYISQLFKLPYRRFITSMCHLNFTPFVTPLSLSCVTCLLVSFSFYLCYAPWLILCHMSIFFFLSHSYVYYQPAYPPLLDYFSCCHLS